MLAACSNCSSAAACFICFSNFLMAVISSSRLMDSASLARVGEAFSTDFVSWMRSRTFFTMERGVILFTRLYSS